MGIRSPAMAASPSPSAAYSRHRFLLDPPPPPPPPFHTSAPTVRSSIPMLLPVFILFFVLACFLSVFLFRDILHFTTTLLSSRGGRGNAERQPSSVNNSSGGATDGDQASPRGLDPVILASFPTLPYSAVRGLQEGKCGVECAVCLGEFAGGDVIRLLTVCCHAFHPHCIDSWLTAHATCPVCRSDLESPPDEAAVLAVREAVGGGERRESHSISIDDDGGGEEGDSRRITKSPSWNLPAELEGS